MSVHSSGTRPSRVVRDGNSGTLHARPGHTVLRTGTQWGHSGVVILGPVYLPARKAAFELAGGWAGYEHSWSGLVAEVSPTVPSVWC